jgi:SET domain-containing protein
MKITFYRNTNLFVGQSKICPSVGLFAGKQFKKNELICIYSGEKLHESEADMRGTIQDEIEETYLFNLDEFYCMDASRIGNLMRYSNHAL